MRALFESTIRYGLAFLIFLLALVPAGNSFAASASGYSEYFIPGDDNLLTTVLDDLDNLGNVAPDGPMHAVISIVAWSANTTVYYDHWEDGYDFDKDNPATADEIHTLVNRGDSWILVGDHIPTNPRGTDQYYDGRDHIYVAGGSVTVARAAWNEVAGTNLAVGWEVYPVRPQLITYIMPFGEDLARDSGKQYWDFDRVYTLIQATADNTVVQVDLDKDGIYDRLDWDRNGTLDSASTTINQGDVILLDRVTMGDQAINGATVDGSTTDNLLIAGTRVQATKTVQVQYIVGDQDSNYEVRGLSAFPRGFWDDEYYAPVHGGASANNGDTDIYLYNPHSTVLTINYQTKTASGSFTIDPQSAISYHQATGVYAPLDSAVYLKGSDVFWGVSIVDTSGNDSTSANGPGRTHDWGYALVPALLMKNEHYMGWSPGAYPLGSSPGTGDPDNNAFSDSGLYISPAQDNIRLYVDYNPTDAIPAVSYDLNRLDSLYVWDPDDGDMTNANIYATGPYVAAYGQNPDLSSPAAPAIDAGYTTIPGNDFIDLVLEMHESVAPAVLPTGPVPQQTILTLNVDSGKYPVDNVQVVEDLPAGWEFVTDSTTITLPDGTLITGAAANPVITGSGPYTLTWPTSLLQSMAPNQESIITFQVQTNQTFTAADISKMDAKAVGSRTVQGITQTFTTTDFSFVAYGSGNLTVTKSSDVAAAAYPGDTVTYTVTVANTGTASLNNIALYDPLPTGVTYVAGSAQLVLSSGSTPLNYLYDFESGAQGFVSSGIVGTTSWERGVPQTNQDLTCSSDCYGSGPTTDHTAGSGVNCWGTDLDDRYANDIPAPATDAGIYLYSPVYDFSGRSSVTLSFWQYLEIEGDSYDHAYLQRRVGAGAWTDVDVYGDGSGEGNRDDNGWSQFTHDASAYADGQFSVQWRWAIDSDVGWQWSGWYIDDVAVTASAAGTPTVHDPPDFVNAASGISLPSGESLTLTYQVTVDDPLATGVTALVNTAYVTSNEIRTPVVATVTDQLINPSQSSGVVGDRVWLDSNGNGIQDVGEPGIANVGVALKDPLDLSLLTSVTDSLGYYLFSGVALDNEYYVAVTAGLPSGVTQTSDNRIDNRTDSFYLRPAGTVNYRDEFSSVSFTNNDGSANWSNGWAESDAFGAGAADGAIWINGGALQFRAGGSSSSDSFSSGDYSGGSGWTGNWTEENDGTKTPDYSNGTIRAKNNRLEFIKSATDDAIRRSVSLTNATSVTVSFDYEEDLDRDDTLIAEYSADGTTWNNLTTIDGNSGTNTFTQNLPAWNPADGTITLRFRAANGTWGNKRYVYLDNVNIDYTASSGDAGSAISRAAYLSSATSATLAFDYAATALDSGDTIIVEASADGSSFTPLETFTGTTGSGSRSYDLLSPTDYSSAVTAIRFRVTSGFDTAAKYFNIDNLDISYSFTDTTTYLNADLGYQPDPGTAIIGDLIWSDADGDGVRDPGEPGLANVPIRLYTDANGNGLIDGGESYVQTTSGADGTYLFTGVAASGSEDYIVWVDPGNLPAYNITAPVSGSYSIIDAAAGGSYLNADFGFRQAAVGTTYTIKDRAWFDLNSSAAQDAGEAGIAGITVNLLDASLNLIASTSTDSSGDFEFTGVPADVRYTWEITDQAGLLSDYFGTTASALDGKFQMANTLTADLDYSISTPHFGYNIARSIGDTVFNDNGAAGGTAGDGVRNGGETGISGVTVLLFQDDGNGTFEPGGADGPPLGTLVTDANGHYLFSGLADGWYWASIDSTQTALSGLSLTSPDDDPSVAGHQQRQQISGGVSNLDADFGYAAPSPGSLFGIVWSDGNSNGAKDSGESGLENVTVDLLTNGVVIATTATDASGQYAFTGLATLSGGVTYTVRVTDTNGVLDGYTATYEKTEQTIPPFNQEENESLTPNENVADITFGYYKPRPTMAVIASFTAQAQNGYVVVAWETASEIGTIGFNLERRDEVTGRFVPVNQRLIPAGIQIYGALYQYVDRTAEVGRTYTYQLVEREIYGSQRIYGPYTVSVTESSLKAATSASSFSSLLQTGYSRQPRGLSPLLAAAARPVRPALRAEAVAAEATSTVPLTATVRVKVSITEAGLYRVGADDLAAVLSAPTDDITGLIGRRAIRLSSQGQPVAWYPADDNSAVYFYGEAFSSIYTDRNVYRISLLAGPIPGDLNGDGEVTLTDLVICGEVLAGKTVAGLRADYITSGADVNGNNKIDPTEMVYIMDSLATVGATDVSVIETVTGELPSAAATAEQTFTASSHFEKEYWPYVDAPIDPDADFWFWDLSLAGNPLVGPFLGFDGFEIETNGVASDPSALYEAQLTVHLYGLSVDAHDAVITLNPDTPQELVLGGVVWSGMTPFSRLFTFNQTKLKAGANKISVVSNTSTDNFGVDSFDVIYQRSYTAQDNVLYCNAEDNNPITVTGFDPAADADLKLFDLAEPKQPLMVENILADGAGGRVTFTPAADTVYLAVNLNAAKAPAAIIADEPSNLKSAANAAQYLVITADGLRQGAEDLANYRHSKGLSTMVVSLSDVFDEFNDGIYDAQAIADFIAHAYNNWAVPPEYVVLVGDGIYKEQQTAILQPVEDSLGLSVDLGNFFVPVLLVRTPYGLYASDNRYGDINNDGMLDVVIGRIPAGTEAEMAQANAKIRAYENSLTTAAKRVLMVADKPDDSGNNFPTDSNAVAALVPADYTVDTIDVAASGPTAAGQQLIDGINSGTWLVNYIGHGGWDVLSDPDPDPNIFSLSVGNQHDLHNGQLPIFVAPTCLVGDFAYPFIDPISEVLTLQDDSGFVAAWSPSGLSVNAEAVQMNQRLFSSLFDVNAPVNDLGHAVKKALELHRADTHEDFMLQIYNLLGDPALSIR